MHRLDTPDKITGKTIYAMDVKRPNMVYAMLARAPKFGGTVKSVDLGAAKATAGVVDVVQVPMGVAVLGTTTWAAKQGRDALKIEWDYGKAETRSSAAILADYKARARQPGLPALVKGNTEAALATADKVIEAEFEFPYLAHAPMEPLNCVVELSDGGCEIWAGSQFQTVEQGAAAAILGIKPEQVKINTLYAGGSFGRRATPSADYYCRGCVHRQGRRRAAPGPLGLDAGGRHQGRLLPSDGLSQGTCWPRQERQDRRLGSPHRRAAVNGRDRRLRLSRCAPGLI